ncbi:MAG: uroporphyrinogen decarboxylase [Planctomycetaceae bacterium]|nr:MAG: uroporphyrinogen decarboxylase [Planctomycetaceae bacterium]
MVLTGRERLTKAFRCEAVDRAPWVPFVGCHGGALLGVTATEYLKSEQRLVEGVEAAIARYQPDGIPVAFDLQIEAEVLGCELNWSHETPPSVQDHPLSNGRRLEELQVPTPQCGRVKTVLAAARELCHRHPEVAFYGLVTGPFTLALHLLGTDIFMKMFDAPDYVSRVMAFCRDVCSAMSAYYLEAGCPIVAMVDPMTSQIGPEQFREFVSPFAGSVFDNIRQRGGLSSFFVCGHAQQNVEVMCDCQPDNISVDENIPLQYVRDVCLARGISFGGNLQLTSVLLLGKPLDAQRNAIACLEIGGDRGFVLAPGCDLPYATPPENLEAVTQVVHDPYQREVVKATVGQQADEIELDMREYGQADKVIVDIITLDSEACAPCQYMVDAVKKVAPEFEGIVVWREHKIKYRESLVFMTSLMVRNVPTICIDGEIRFVSRIPPRDQLIAAIQDRINEKFRMKIARRKASLYVLGDGGPECQELLQQCQRAVAELGVEAHVNVVTDAATIASYGVASVQTPAVVIARYVLKSTRRVPDVAIIKEWLKDVH